MHSYILFPSFSCNNGIIFLRSRDNKTLFSRDKFINLRSREYKTTVYYIKSLQETSFSVAMSEEQEHIDNRITYLFNQGLTQAEIALCLAITDNIHINVCYLWRGLARFQL